jgi:hypothetical protein
MVGTVVTKSNSITRGLVSAKYARSLRRKVAFGLTFLVDFSLGITLKSKSNAGNVIPS